MKYPMQHNGEGGWTIEVKFLKRLQDEIRTRGFEALSLEQIEEVLLAVENLPSAGQNVEPDTWYVWQDGKLIPIQADR